MNQSQIDRVITIKPIGIIRSPHRQPEKTPIQPVYARGVKGSIELFSEFEQGLQDLETFSHIHILYLLDRADAPRLQVAPYLENRQHGIFATRAPNRPNGIGMSLVRLCNRDGRILEIEDVDILDQTPLLDIKPYITRFDTREDAHCGWLEDIDEEQAQRLGSRTPPGDEEPT